MQVLLKESTGNVTLLRVRLRRAERTSNASKVSRAAELSNCVSTLWMEEEIRKVDQVCLKSLVRAGLNVTPHHYGPISRVPPGVRTADAYEILDLSLLERLLLVKRVHHRHNQPEPNFSDFFRIFLLKYDRGLWLDSDVFVLRPFQYDRSWPFFAREGGGRIGSPVIYVPPNHPIIGQYEALIEQPVLMPDWMRIRRGLVRPTW